MSMIQVRNVPPELHEAARQRAKEHGTSLSEYVKGLLTKDVYGPARRKAEVLAALERRIAELPPEELDELPETEPFDAVAVIREMRGPIPLFERHPELLEGLEDAP
jgi:plasmid stability protein